MYEFLSSQVIAWFTVYFFEEGEELRTLLAGVCFVNAVSHALFILSVEKGKRRRFFVFNGSTRDHFKEQFFRTDIDEIKAHAASVTPIFTVGWRDDIESWFLNNYARWKREKKAFLNERFLAFMDD